MSLSYETERDCSRILPHSIIVRSVQKYAPSQGKLTYHFLTKSNENSIKCPTSLSADKTVINDTSPQEFEPFSNESTLPSVKIYHSLSSPYPQTTVHIQPACSAFCARAISACARSVIFKNAVMCGTLSAALTLKVTKLRQRRLCRLSIDPMIWVLVPTRSDSLRRTS